MARILLGSLLLLTGLCHANQDMVFIRGDVNADETLNIGDPIALLSHLFSGAAILCDDAADANDDGKLDIADAIFDLAFLFASGEAPPAPYPERGGDATEDNLACAFYPGNEAQPTGRLVLLWDNAAADPHLHAAWGFSCLVVRGPEVILVDTGADGPQFLENMQYLQVDPRDVTALLLSHVHSDHLGGLESFLGENPQLAVYIPASFPQSIRETIEQFPASVVEVNDPIPLSDGIFSTGDMLGSPREQGLVAKTPKGAVVIVPCAHPGLIAMITRAQQIAEQDIYLVLGGFHLFKQNEREVRRVISEVRNLGVQKVAPCHCTGEGAKQLFREAYGEDYFEVGAGSVVEF